MNFISIADEIDKDTTYHILSKYYWHEAKLIILVLDNPKPSGKAHQSLFGYYVVPVLADAVRIRARVGTPPKHPLIALP